MAEIFIGRLRKRYPGFILGNTQCSDSNVLRDYFPWECFPLLLIGRRVILNMRHLAQNRPKMLAEMA